MRTDLAFEPNQPPQEVMKWLQRLKSLMNTQPKSIKLFANGTLYAIVATKDGKMPMTKDGGVDGEAEIGSLGKCEGGDW